MSLFIDTGVLFGAAARGDSKHKAAAALLRRAPKEAPFATDYVVLEAWMMLRSRNGWNTAMTFLDSLRESSLHVETVSPSDIERARAILHDWRDLELDLVDGASIAVME